MVAKKTDDDQKVSVRDKEVPDDDKALKSDEKLQDGKDGRDNTKTLTRDAKQHEIIAEDEKRSNEQGQVHHAYTEQAAASGGALRRLFDEQGNEVLVLDARPTEQRYYDSNGYPVERAKRPEELAPAWTDPKEFVKQVQRGFIVLSDEEKQQVLDLVSHGAPGTRDSAEVSPNPNDPSGDILREGAEDPSGLAAEHGVNNAGTEKDRQS